MGYRRRWMWLLGLGVQLPATVMACPACKDAITGDPVATALSATTLVLIGLPLSLIVGIGVWVARAHLHAERRAATFVDEPVGNAVLYPALKEGE